MDRIAAQRQPLLPWKQILTPIAPMLGTRREHPSSTVSHSVTTDTCPKQALQSSSTVLPRFHLDHCHPKSE